MSNHSTRTPTQSDIYSNASDPDSSFEPRQQDLSSTNPDSNNEQGPQVPKPIRSRPSIPEVDVLSESRRPSQQTPLITLTEPLEPSSFSQFTPTNAPDLSQEATCWHRNRTSFPSSASQPSTRPSTPSARRRSQSQPQTATSVTATAMSSAGSSPGSTTTTASAGPYSQSGSNPNYHLPYAPFPFQMPDNKGGSNQQGGQSK